VHTEDFIILVKQNNDSQSISASPKICQTKISYQAPKVDIWYGTELTQGGGDNIFESHGSGGYYTS